MIIYKFYFSDAYLCILEHSVLYRRYHSNTAPSPYVDGHSPRFHHRRVELHSKGIYRWLHCHCHQIQSQYRIHHSISNHRLDVVILSSIQLIHCCVAPCHKGVLMQFVFHSSGLTIKNCRDSSNTFWQKKMRSVYLQ